MTPAPVCSLDPVLAQRPRVVWGMALALGLVGAWLRFRALDAQSFWIDEVLGVEWARGTLADLFAGLAQDRWKPPLDYLILHLFLRWGGETETWARLHSAIFGTLTLPVFFLWLRSACGPTTGLVALALLVFSPLHHRYSQDATPYALYVFTTTLATWSLWELARCAGTRARWWVVYGVSTLAALWTLFLTPLMIALHQAWIWSRWLVARHRGEAAARALGWTALGALLMVMLGMMTLVIRWMQLSSAMGSLTESPLFPFEPWTLQYLSRAVGCHIFGHDATPIAGVIFWCALPILAVAVVWLGRRLPSLATLCVLQVVGSQGGILLMCAMQNHWHTVRYPIAGMTPLLALVAVGITLVLGGAVRLLVPAAAGERARQIGLSCLLVVALLIGGGWATHQIITNPYRHPESRELVQWLIEEDPAGPPVLVRSPIDSIQIGYYLRRLGTRIPLECHFSVDQLMQRTEELSDCHVVLSWDKELDTLARRMRGRPPLDMPLHRLNVWRLFDLEAWYAAHPARTAEATGQFAREGHHLDIGAESYWALQHGWGATERFNDIHPFRWSEGTAPSVLLPLEEPRHLFVSFRAMTYDWGGAPPQATVVSVNGHEVGHGVIIMGWFVYGVAVPAEVLRAGMNRIDFTLDHAGVPALVAGSASDDRALGIGVDWIDLSEGLARPAQVDHDWSSTSPLLR